MPGAGKPKHNIIVSFLAGQLRPTDSKAKKIQIKKTSISRNPFSGAFM